MILLPLLVAVSEQASNCGGAVAAAGCVVVRVVRGMIVRRPRPDMDDHPHDEAATEQDMRCGLVVLVRTARLVYKAGTARYYHHCLPTAYHPLRTHCYCSSSSSSTTTTYYSSSTVRSTSTTVVAMHHSCLLPRGRGVAGGGAPRRRQRRQAPLLVL